MRHHAHKLSQKNSESKKTMIHQCIDWLTVMLVYIVPESPVKKTNSNSPWVQNMHKQNLQ